MWGVCLFELYPFNVVPLAIGFLIKGNDFTLPLIAVSAMALIGVGSYIFLVGKIERVPEKG
jgi:ACS family D-galactonate transporter-like MFS transporter